MILLDTHVAIWVTTDNSRLGEQSRTLLNEARQLELLSISAISFWEIGMLIEKGRLASSRSAAEYRTGILSTGVKEVALTGDLAIAAAGLKALHRDPADRFILATAIAHDATLVTADRQLLAWEHPLQRQDASQ